MSLSQSDTVQVGEGREGRRCLYPGGMWGEGDSIPACPNSEGGAGGRLCRVWGGCLYPCLPQPISHSEQLTTRVHVNP